MVVGDFAIELDTVVIGSGPGGYVAAIRAAQLGQKVAIVEKENIGGVCLNVGCIPSKALISAGHHYQDAMHSEVFGVTAENVVLDFAKTQEWKNNKVVKSLTSGVEMLLKKHKVEILRGEAFFVDEHDLRVMTETSAQSYTFNNAIVATGSRPIEIKGFKFGKRIIDSTGGLALQEVPKKLVVIGGGYIGSELAGAYANLGAEVTILEGSPSILPNFEKDMVKFVTDNFKKKNVTIETGAMAKEAIETADGVTVKYGVNGAEKSIDADYVMVTVGRRPNTDELGLEQAGVEVGERGLITVDAQGRTNKPNIYAIGDIVPGLALAHKASYEAKIAAEAISGKKVAVDYKAMPAVCFTDPELASVGLTQAEAKAEGMDVKASKFPLQANGRALSLDATEGFVRLVTTKEDNVLVGAQVAGVGASDIIAELGLAIESGMNAEDIALTVHAHPSLAETVMDAAELALGMPIHI
ncbi:dihydrolipoyl dehydrogenase [Carnobacterium divergens]|uniref:Dihydrolipoyl dehydrogenase n=1 Tax=Carnobacterium divergens TaxID=2748 RepID=A0A7Z8G4T7_CARDV|nr:dihydrolipoyl dehydrogenase [Carnobacterium divergens]TFI71594.1 dihydrolipoyl dehydrogenase [Carnobacterium divergens]TFI76236.1 dihydrolipoyl dehydrogenase [Carnobacterium divergens]TFI82108.1 dihydrolipoyl dehydrogenase [Carnobacterium divergens]TFI94417.1 dihydrolipoyl dehydrogenase [Carnobacterium divergens]TFJ10697.1 dihydrolipoyl dehydrogenase [Carnobacterium divergens]